MVNTNLDTTPLPPNNLVAQDPQSAELAGYVRTKTFGRDVRESIARSIELNSTRSKSAEILANETLAVTNRIEEDTATATQEMANQVELIRAEKDAVIANATVDSEVILARGGKATLGQRLDETTAQLNHTAKKVSYSEIQSSRLASFYYKLMTKQSIVGVCQGDSLTYGHDTVSADNRPGIGVTDDGVNLTFTRASTTYPEQLQANLREIYGNSATTIINKGVSGDYAGLSLRHWTRNSNADVALVMLGTNDASNASHIPTDIQKNIEVYVRDMRIIIERYLDWNTPVILLTPPRLRGNEIASTSSQYIKAFRDALFYLGKEYGCPVIDTEELCNGLDNTYYSDGTHFNGKGYTHFANRLTSAFVGFIDRPSIYPDSVISIRPTRDNYVINGATITNSTISSGPEEGGGIGSSLLMNIGADNSVYLSFYAETDNLVLLPVHGLTSGANAKYSLDGGTPQGSVPLLQAIKRQYNSERLYSPTEIISTVSTNGAQTYDFYVDISKTNEYLHIANKGLHFIKIENSSNVGTVLFQGFVVKSYSEFSENQADNLFSPTFEGTTTSGTHVYNKRISRIVKINGMVYHFVNLNISVGENIQGSAFIRLKEKLINVANFELKIPIQFSGVLSNSIAVGGLMTANGNLLYLTKTINGVTSNLTSSDVAGKTLDIAFTAIYPITV